jgi:hypothetical protein
MFDGLVQLVVPLAFFASLAFTVVGVTKLITDSRVRRRLVEANASPETAAAVLAPLPADPGLLGALKWGLVTLAVGAALIVVQFLPYRPDEPIVLGVVLVFAAAGLLAYYARAKRPAARAV